MILTTCLRFLSSGIGVPGAGLLRNHGFQRQVTAVTNNMDQGILAFGLIPARFNQRVLVDNYKKKMDTALNYCDTRSKKLMKSLDFSSDNSMSTDGQIAGEMPSPGEQDFRRRLNKGKQSTPINQKPIPQPRKSKSLASSRASDSESSSCSTYSRTSSSKTNDETRQHETAAPTTKSRTRRESSDCDEVSSAADIELLKAQINQLTTELKVEKRKGNKINEKLRLCQSELTAARTELELEKLNKEGYGNGVISDAVEELYRAQKEREQAMVARIQQAQKERDEAVLRAKAYMKDITNKEDSPKRNVKNNNVDKLIDSISSAETPRSAHKISQELSEYWLNIIKEKKDKHEEQVRALMDERDTLRRKLHLTNQELEELKTHNISEINDRKTETESERDMLKKQLSKVQDDLETVRLQYSLEHSLKRHQMTNEKGDAARLCESLRIANEQHRLLKENSERMKMKIEILTENNKKHERHIHVLRKKLATAAERASSNTNERKNNKSKEKTRSIL